MAKLLQINVCYGYYSTGRIAEDISLKVQTEGWESYAAYQGGLDVKHTATLLPVGNKLSKYEHFIPSFLFDRHGLASSLDTKKLIAEIEKIKPDIVHLHNIHGYYLNIKILLEYLAKKKYPVVATTHDCWLFTGHCAHFTKIGCDKWKAGCHDCQLLSSYPRALTDRTAFNYGLKKDLFNHFSNLHIVAVSHWLGDTVKNSFLKKHDIRVIQNGVDTDKFHIIDLSSIPPLFEEDSKIVVGVSSTWYEDKGLNDYYALSEILPDGIKICLVGVSKGLRKRLPDNIIGITRTNNINELVWLYNRASAVLSLSQGETFGLTIAEGYACGTPAVVYDNTALPELITPETGFVVPTGNIEKVKEAIMRILSKNKSAYSSACRSLALNKYNKSDRIEEYFNLYKEVLNGK